MAWKDGVRIIRTTDDPVEVTARLRTLALFAGTTPEAYAGWLLQHSINAIWECVADEDMFKIDCECCRPGAQQVEEPAAH